MKSAAFNALLALATLSPVSRVAWAAPAPKPEAMRASLASSDTLAAEKARIIADLCRASGDKSPALLRSALLGEISRDVQLLTLGELAASSFAADLLDPLGELLRWDAQVSALAATAMARHSDSGAVLVRFRDFLTNQTYPPANRRAVITAVGQIPHPQAIALLMDFVQDDDPDLVAAACDGLSLLTGQTRPGHRIERWLEWYEPLKSRTAADWMADLARRKAGGSRQLEQRLLALREQAAEMITRDYLALPADQRPARLLSLLSGQNPDIRLTAVRLARADFTGGRPPTAAVVTRVEQMLADPLDDIRMEAPGLLALLNDPNTTSLLLGRLGVELDEDIRRSLALALGETRDPAAVPGLERLLQGDTLYVAQAAARSLGQIAQASPDGGAAIRLVLRRRLDAMEAAAAQPRPPLPNRAYGPLRHGLLEAMASLAAPDLAGVFTHYTRQSLYPATIRVLAYRGLGRCGNQDHLRTVTEGLRDPVAIVRLEALGAMANLGNSTMSDAVAALWSQAEPEEEVRRLAWRTFLKLLTKDDSAPALRWKQTFADRGETQQQMEVLLAIEPGWAGKTDVATGRLVAELGGLLLTHNRSVDALPRLRRAVDTLGEAGSPADIAGLPEAVVTAAIRCGAADVAAEFVTTYLKAHPSLGDAIGAALCAEIRNMSDSGAREQALLLLKRVQDVPQLSAFSDRFQQLDRDIRKAMRSGTYLDWPDFGVCRDALHVTRLAGRVG